MILKMKKFGNWEFKTLTNFNTKRYTKETSKVYSCNLDDDNATDIHIKREIQKLKIEEFYVVDEAGEFKSIIILDEAYLISEINGNTIANLSPKYSSAKTDKTDNTNTYKNHWIKLFRKVIDKKESLVIDLPYGVNNYEYLHRQTGKTYALLSLYKEFENKCVFISTYDRELLNKAKNEFDINNLETYYYREIFNSQLKDKIILIDESNLTGEQLDKLKENYIVIGFTRSIQ